MRDPIPRYHGVGGDRYERVIARIEELLAAGRRNP